MLVVVPSSVQPCSPTDCSPSGSSVHGILQARIAEWVGISYSRGSSQPRAWTCVSCASYIGRWILYHCATWEAKQNITEEKSDGKRFTRELWKPNKRSLALDRPAVPQWTRYQYSLIIWEMILGPKQEHFRTKNILIISLPLFTLWILRKYLQKLNQFVASVYFVAVECLMHVKSYSVVFLEKYSYCW